MPPLSITQKSECGRVTEGLVTKRNCEDERTEQTDVDSGCACIAGGCLCSLSLRNESKYHVSVVCLGTKSSRRV